MRVRIIYEFGSTSITLKNKFSTGAAWRLQESSDKLLGKLNVPGQQDLCAADNCYSLTGDPGPNARLVAARGTTFGHLQDDGNINYKRYDLVYATNKLESDLTLVNGDFLVRVRAVAFYDPVNADFNTFHNNTNFQPAFTKRSNDIANDFAKGARLYDAYVQYNTEILGQAAVLSVGQQSVRWGESNLFALNSISEINPPNANFLHLPGGEIKEIFQPVPVVSLAGDVSDTVSAELIYQFGWKKTEPDASGSFQADSDIAGDGRYAVVALGQFPEDPDGNFRLAGALGLISDTSLTVYPREIKPSSQGQFGLRVNYNAEWLGSGTEFGFYGLNYHSRLPYVSVISSDESCARDSTGIADALIACDGFNGTLPRLTPTGGEPLPIDTMQVLLEYPENIQMVGISFNTTIGKFSVSGEYSYRPNIPVQVHLPDVIYAGLQPSFPINDIVVDPTNLSGAAGGGVIGTVASAANALGLTGVIPIDLIPALAEAGAAALPSGQHAIPSFLAAYRNLGRIGPNQYISGYERLGMGQFDITAIRIWSTNPFGADQIILLSEVGFQHVVGMPSRDRLQFGGNSANDSHFGAGGDGTGLTAANSCNDAITGSPSDFTCKLNPTQQTRGFADEFAWGVRFLARMEYNNVIFGWGFRPTFAYYWDIDGTAPYPQQNFVQGRMEFQGGTDINITPSFVARVMYQSYFGGKAGENTRADRDNIALNFSYAF